LLNDNNALVVIATPPFGGAEKRYLRLYQELSIYSNKLYLMINTNALHAFGSNEVLAAGNITVIDQGLGLPKHKSLFRFLSYIVWPFLIVIKAKRLNIRHLHYAVNPGYISAMLALLAGLCKISFSLSVVDSSKTSKDDFNLAERMCWKYSLNRAKLIDALSPGIKSNLKVIFGTGVGSKTRVSPCSFSNYSSNTMKLENSKDVDLVFAARFVDGKGINLFIETLQILDQKQYRPPLSVHICGQGPLEAIIHGAVKQFNSIKVSVYWAENISVVFARAKVFLSLQQKENYPSQAVLEAANQEVAVIVTDVGDTRLFVNDSNAILVKNSAQEVADAIELLLGNNKLREELGCNLRNYILKNHTLERYAEYFIAFLKEANEKSINVIQQGDFK
jgi:glycosyltransferase involved in cell wall biosynthesis